MNDEVSETFTQNFSNQIMLAKHFYNIYETFLTKLFFFNLQGNIAATIQEQGKLASSPKKKLRKTQFSAKKASSFRPRPSSCNRYLTVENHFLKFNLSIYIDRNKLILKLTRFCAFLNSNTADLQLVKKWLFITNNTHANTIYLI